MSSNTASLVLEHQFWDKLGQRVLRRKLTKQCGELSEAKSPALRLQIYTRRLGLRWDLATAKVRAEQLKSTMCTNVGMLLEVVAVCWAYLGSKSKFKNTILRASRGLPDTKVQYPESSRYSPHSHTIEPAFALMIDSLRITSTIYEHIV